jgi:5-oxoprolinase (ATP-hydrolysing)
MHLLFQVKGVGKTFDSLGESVYDEVAKLERRRVDKSPKSVKVDSHQDVFVSPPGSMKGRRESVAVFQLGSLDVGDVVEGPALIIDATQTIFVNA